MKAETFLHQNTSELKHRIRVWDLPTRLFHWLLVLDIIGLFVTGYLGALDWHMRLGYAMFSLLLFRLVWGMFGGYWSRFASFYPSPRRIWHWLRAKPEEASSHVGHNPLGALSVWAMLLVLLAQVGSGLMSDDDISFAGPWVQRVSGVVSQWMTNYHAAIGQWMLVALVLLHIGAILFYLFGKHDNLVGPMVHGNKIRPLAPSPSPSSRDDYRTRLLALTLLLICVALVWLLTGFAV